MSINILIYGPGNGARKLKLVQFKSYFQIWCEKKIAKFSYSLKNVHLKGVFVCYAVDIA